MIYTLGFILFALAIGVSIALHEVGHLATAKMFGMYARRYFIGFGPRIWSFRRGETEYGLKVIPAGGFTDIAGMVASDPLPEPYEKRAFWRFPAWQRVIVMSAGSITHFLIAIVVAFIMAMTLGLPSNRAVVDQTQACVVETGAADGGVRDCRAGDPTSPASAAGLRHGDRIVSIDGIRIDSNDELITTVRARPGETVPMEYVRDGHTERGTLAIASARRAPIGDEKADDSGLVTVGVIGVAPALIESYGPTDAVGATGRFLGTTVSGTFEAIGRFPSRIPLLFDALTGDERDPETPVSVVGASRIGGEALAAGSWLTFLLLLVVFNLFIGIFNLFPLLPLDGGHIAILLFEKVRAFVARLFRRADPGRVDLYKLMPVTYVVIIVFGGISALTIIADVFNPIRLTQ